MLSSLWYSLSFVVGVCSVSASDRFQGGELRPPLLKLLDQLLPLKLSRLLHHLPHKPSPNVHRPSHCLQVLENGIIVCREKEGERGRERERGGERGREGERERERGGERGRKREGEKEGERGREGERGGERGREREKEG